MSETFSIVQCVVCVCVLFVQGSGHDIKTKFMKHRILRELLAGVVFSIPYPWDVHHEPTDLNELFSSPGDMGVKKIQHQHHHGIVDKVLGPKKKTQASGKII